MQRVNRILGQVDGTQTTVSSTQVGAYTKKPVRVAVTGAGGNIGYSIVHMIASGLMLGPDQPIILHLIELPQFVNALKGLEMELIDCAFPLLTDIICTGELSVGFKAIDIAVLVGSIPRGPGMDRAELLSKNAGTFKDQGSALNQYANKNVKVLVVGNPANTNAYIAMKNAPTIPSENFHALTRLDHNRTVGLITDVLQQRYRSTIDNKELSSLSSAINANEVRNVVIWGNHSDSMVPDISHAVVTDYPSQGRVTPLSSLFTAEQWAQHSGDIAKRGGAIIKARGKSSAMSAAQAAVHHMRDWVLGTAKGEWVSVSLPSDGSYGVPKGMMFSFPCICYGGNVSIVRDLPLTDDVKAKINKNIVELTNEAKMAGYPFE